MLFRDFLLDAKSVLRIDRIYSKTSYYSIPIPPSASSTIHLAINEVYNHITEPKPKLMAQDNQGQAMFWQGDLLAGVSGLQDGSDITVRVK